MEQNYMPFIISTVSDFTKRYVEVENSEELSVALEAFHDAQLHYAENKGNFLTFARKVIRNRLIDAIRKNQKVQEIPIDETELVMEDAYENLLAKQELQRYEEVLHGFGLSYEVLMSQSPKHQDTQQFIKKITWVILQDEVVLAQVLLKRKLPITEIHTKYDFSIKVLKTHKNIILAMLIAHVEQISTVTKWLDIRKEVNEHDSRNLGIRS